MPTTSSGFAGSFSPLPVLKKSVEVRAWSNGESGPNGYGTHDWILDKAIRALERRNNKADWVKLQVFPGAAQPSSPRDAEFSWTTLRLQLAGCVGKPTPHCRLPDSYFRRHEGE